MMNSFLCFIFMLIPAYFQVLAMEEMIVSDEKRLNRKMRILIWMLYFAFGVGIRVLVNNQEKTQLFTLIHGVGGFIVFVVVFYRETLWKGVMVAIALLLGTSMSEIMLLFVIPKTSMDSLMEWNFHDIQITMMMALGTVLSSIGIWLVMIVWKRVFDKERTPKHAFFLCVYSMIQIVSFSEIRFFLVDGAINPSIYYSMITSIICSLSLAFVVFNETQMQKIQVELVETNRRKELEDIHYSEVSIRRKELEKITKENDQRMEKIEKMLDEDRTEQAKKELMSLLERIEMTREYPYCGIHLVNVVLTDKQKECEAKGIKLEINVDFLDETEIKQVDLCSAFSNIIDNAIRACSHLKSEIEGMPVINLRVGVFGEYLIIKCENPYEKNIVRFPEGSGYGLKILKDIANKYKGVLQTKRTEDTFYTQLNMRIGKI